MDRYPYFKYTILLGATRALAHIGINFTHRVFGLSLAVSFFYKYKYAFSFRTWYKAYSFSFTTFFFKFVMPILQYEKFKYCSNIVDARMVLCLVELIIS